jgi:hypothetical protein
MCEREERQVLRQKLHQNIYIKQISCEETKTKKSIKLTTQARATYQKSAFDPDPY